jgi:cytidylate kinase
MAGCASVRLLGFLMLRCYNLSVSRAPLITIDGVAGSGKTTLGRLIANEWGWAIIDTGAYFRVTSAILGEEHPLGIAAEEFPAAALKAAQTVATYFRVVHDGDDDKVGWMRTDGSLVTDARLRRPEATRYLSEVAATPGVRVVLTECIRALGDELLVSERCVVGVGRDCGTVIWPNADAKFYLEAPVEIRTMRRQSQFAGNHDDLVARDLADSTRETAPMRKADDAVSLDSHRYAPEELLLQIQEHLHNDKSLHIGEFAI